MFTTLKKWFEGKPASDGTRNRGRYDSALASRGVNPPGARAGAPAFQGTKMISEEVIGRVAKGIELEGLGILGSSNPKNKDGQDLGRG